MSAAGVFPARVLQSGRLLQLNMNMAASDIDLGWLLPQRQKNNWSAERALVAIGARQCRC